MSAAPGRPKASSHRSAQHGGCLMSHRSAPKPNSTAVRSTKVHL